MAEIVVDARGHRCPTPSLRLRRALQTAVADDVVVLLADDPLAAIDVPHLVGQLGATLVQVETVEDFRRFSVRR